MLSSRAFAQTVEVINPGESVPDADDTMQLPGPDVATDGHADLWQLNLQQQVLDDRGNVVADWKGLFEPSLPVTSSSKVRDVATDLLYRVHGQPALQRSLLSGEPDHIAAHLKFISDQQGAPS